MNVFKNRPLALGCAVFLLSLAALFYEDIGASVVALSIGALLSFALFILNRFRPTSSVRRMTVYLIPIVIALIVSGILSLAVFQRDKGRTLEYMDKSGEYTVFIEGVEYESFDRSSYIGRIEELDIRVVIVTYGRDMELGQKIVASLTLESLSDKKYGEDASGRYREDGILMGAECTDFTVKQNCVYSVSLFFEKLNYKMSQRIDAMTSNDTSALISAILLGDKSDLTNESRRDFARLGISHILALSGIHLSIMAAMTSGLLSGIGFGKRWRYALTLVLIWGFIGLTGFSSSVLRAGLMLTILYLMFFIRIRADFVTRIFVAVSMICVILPYSVFSISLLLSFFAMLGCVITSYALGKKNRFGRMRGIVGGITTTVAVSLITLPIAFLRFDFLSVVSPLTNLIFIPIFTLLLYLSPILLAFGNVPILGSAVVWLCESVSSVILHVAGAFSDLTWIAVPFNSRIHPYAVLVIFLSVLTFMLVDKRRAYISVVSLAVGCSLFVTGSVYTFVDLNKNVYVYTDGNDRGDITYVRNDGAISVVDCHPASIASASAIYSDVVDMGYCEIENYVVTDYSIYTVDALDYLSSVTVMRNLYVPEPIGEDEALICESIYSRLSKNGVNVFLIDGEIDLDSVDLKISCEEVLKRSKKRLVVFSVEGETSRYTYVGASVYEGVDAFDYAERYISSSDTVYFGIYGPEYEVRFNFDISNVKYCMFSPGANYYSGCDTDGVRTVMPGRVFILK